MSSYDSSRLCFLVVSPGIPALIDSSEGGVEDFAYSVVFGSRHIYNRITINTRIRDTFALT